LLPTNGETSKLSEYSGDSLYVEGEVKFVNDVEFGAENGSRSKSFGETVPMLAELDEDIFALISYGATAGEE
jgi:hypothetical protein